MPRIMTTPCRVFSVGHDAVSVWDCMASKVGKIHERWTGRGHGTIKILSCHLPGGTEKNHKDLLAQPRSKVSICQIPIQSTIATPAHLGFDINKIESSAQIGNVYSRIHLIQHPHDWTGAGLSNCALSDSACTALTSYMWFLLLLLYMGCTTNQRSIPFGYHLQLLVQGHQCPLLCFLYSLQFLPAMLKEQNTVDQGKPQRSM